MSKAVNGGVIHRLSPSMINAYDETSAFGCARRWYFKYVLDQPEPQTGNQALGTSLHATNEAFLKSKPVDLFDMQVEGLFLAGKKNLESLLPVVKKVEAEVKLDVAGIPMVGFCDLVTTEPGIWDWKTTSSIEQYGKTPGQLAKDNQLILYALAEHPNEPKVKLAHGQYQTKGRASFNVASVEISKERLADHFGTVILPLVEAMKVAATETEVRAVKANRNACRMCPHRASCPSDQENPTMSFFKKYQTNNVAPTAASVTTLPVSQAQTVTAAPAQPILPPDAPKSDPALNAKPVEGFSPVPAPKERRIVITDIPAEPPSVELADAGAVAVEPPPAPVKRGPGRPPGSKNKPKDGTPAPVLAPMPIPPVPALPPITPDMVKPVPPSQRAVVSPEFIFSEVTVSYGATVNTGNFNSIRLDVSMTAKHSGDADAAYAAVLAKVMEKVQAEVEKINALPKAAGAK